MHQSLLDQQASQYLSPELRQNPEVQALLACVGNTYERFARQSEGEKRAIEACRREYERMNQELESLIDQRHRSIKQLQRAVAELIGAESAEYLGDDLVTISQDIRGQVHLNEVIKGELNRNINLFTALLNNLQSAALIENEHDEILFTNDQFQDFFSCALSPENIVGADAREAREACKHIFQDPDGFVTQIDKIVAKREPVYNERIPMKDGRILERDYVPIFVEGEYKGHLWKFNDVTERVRHEDQLRESEERLRLVMDGSLDAIVITDDRGMIEGWNPRAEEIFGWSYDEVYGEPAVNVIMNDELREDTVREMTNYLAAKAEDGYQGFIETSVINRDGKKLQVELVIVAYKQHGRDYYAGFYKDISARKQWENLLREQEAKYRNMISDMNLGLLNITLDHEIVYANQGFCRMTGYTEEELLGSHTDLFKYDDSSKQIARTKMSLSRQGISGTMEIAARNKAGERRWWFVSGGPSYNDRGVQTGAVVIYLDITDQKRLETELEAAKVNAEKASVAKEAFLANMSHEIRTPLNAIIGMIRELSRENLTPKQQNYLSHTDSAARHLLSIVNSILDISKIEAGELELDHHDFSLEALIANLRSILHIKAEQKGLALNCNLSPEVWPVHLGDSARLRQVLINLLGNAIKFTMQGSVSLEVNVVEHTPEGQHLRIEVIDTGIGMDEAYLDDIFSKFSQAERSTSRRFGGTGLGMAITKEFIQLMGGEITVTSEKDQGTRFAIDLVLPEGDIEKLTGNQGQDEHLLEGTHILLVEDNVMNRFIAKKCLSHFGCTVEEAENGRIALEMLRDKQYDIVLMDIQMPELDGVATTKIIRGELKLDIPIIAVTANAFKQDIDLYLSIGMNDYVTKPFEEQALFETLARQLAAAGALRHPALTEAEDSYDLTDLEQIGRGDQAFVKNMVGIFVDQTPQAVREIHAAVAERDYQKVAETAHRIKPSIDSMGINQLDGVAKDIENYAKSGEVEHEVLVQKVAIFAGTLARVIEKLREDVMTLQ